MHVEDVESFLGFKRGLGDALESIVKHGFYVCPGTER